MNYKKLKELLASSLMIPIYVLIFTFCFYFLACSVAEIKTGNGSHTGYITGLNRTGLFVKSNAVYIQTSPNSSRSHQYCVLDKNVYKKLQQYSATNKQIVIYYYSRFINPIFSCDGEDFIISDVKSI